MEKHLIVNGHCYSKKNHYHIWGRGRGVRIVTDEKFDHYEYEARRQLREQWKDRESLHCPVKIRIEVYYAGSEPDEPGPLEAIYDLLASIKNRKDEALEILRADRKYHPVLADDVWLHLAELQGKPCIQRLHCKKKDERVEIFLKW